MNITEDYVSFEVAKLLKERGFDEKTLSYYEDNVLCRGDWFEWNRSPLGHIAAPTHQMAMAWLREVHNINIDIVPIWNRNRWEYQIFIVTPATSQRPYVANTLYLDYEEAVEEALKYSLENLI